MPVQNDMMAVLQSLHEKTECFGTGLSKKEQYNIIYDAAEAWRTVCIDVTTGYNLIRFANKKQITSNTSCEHNKKLRFAAAKMNNSSF